MPTGKMGWSDELKTKPADQLQGVISKFQSNAQVGLKKCEKMQKYAQICKNMRKNVYVLRKNGYILRKN